jgi:hypothetical protein
MEVDWEERMQIAKDAFVSMMGRKCKKQETHDWYLRKQWERIRIIRQFMDERDFNKKKEGGEGENRLGG